MIWIAPMALLTDVSAPLLGSSVFLADQTGCRFRFLAERGIPPRLVWLSRHIRGLLVMLLGLLLMLIAIIASGFITTIMQGRQVEDWLLITECALGFAVVAYCCGQFCSMGLRSGLLAATFGAILTVLVCLWADMMYWLCLSWLWSVAPILIAFMVATWWHAPYWLEERKSWRERFRLAFIIAVPLVAILVAIPLVRVYGIPLVELGFDVEELTRPVTTEEHETLALYRRAFHLAHLPTTDESARQKAKEQAIALALEASRRPHPWLILHSTDELNPNTGFDLANLLLTNGNQLQSDGKLAAALDNYMAALRMAVNLRRQFGGYWAENFVEIDAYKAVSSWAAQSGQTPTRVLAAIRALEQLWQSSDSFCDAIKHHYISNLRYLKSDWVGKRNGYEVLWRLPWERDRALRMLNQLTAKALTQCQVTEEAEKNYGDAAPLPSAVAVPSEMDREPTYDLVRNMVRPWISTVVGGVNQENGIQNEYLAIETWRRATLLIMALEAWKLDHGDLPKSLEDLEGKYLNRLPTNPFNGFTFDYAPKGIADYLVSSTPRFFDQTLAPRRPFLACGTWSAPAHSLVSEDDPKPPEDVRAASPRTAIWRNVWVFPIP
jgi:MFS family permease